MKTLINYPVKVFVTGFIVLIFLSLSLFWIRLACETSISQWIPADARISPSGLVPPELENDPNVVSPSHATAYMHRYLPMSLGIINYFQSRFPGGRRSNIYFLDYKNQTWMYFDKESGQIIYFYTERQIMPDKTSIMRKVQLYIGPEGVSETPEKTLGKFIEPIADRPWMIWHSNKMIVYDKKLQCFFKINFNERTVVKGLEIPQNSSRKPIQIGYLIKEPARPSLSFSPPQIKNPVYDSNGPRLSSDKFKSIIPSLSNYHAGPYLPVLDETGRIDLLDKETLEFVPGTSAMPGPYGRLPAPETYFGMMRNVTPKNLLDYEVLPLVLNKYYLEDDRLFKMTFGGPYDLERVAYRAEQEYLGMFVASASDDGTSMAVAVFDENGGQINLGRAGLTGYDGRNYTPSSKTAYWGTPWAPFSSICKYATENVHPPILSIASIFTASSFEAGAGYRSLFLLPNSFAAMNARNGHGNIAERLLFSLWIMVPAIILSIWLAVRVKKDAVVTGLSENSRLCWILGTLAFGLAAFITFKLTKPKITLVTCSNCGKPRRPDMDKCHRCKSGWHVPELTPPNWRVLGIEN